VTNPRIGRSAGMRLLVLVIAGAFLFPGCGEGDETTDPAPSGDEPLVEYSRGGGFAPSFEGLVVQADGDGELKTGGFRPEDQEITKIKVTGEDLSELEQLVAGADLDEFEGGEGVCADCYEYEITADGTTVSFSDVDLDTEFAGGNVPEGMSELLAELQSIVSANTPAGEPSIGG